MPDDLATPASCDICGGPLTPLYAAVRDPQTGETFDIDQCEACTLGRTRPQPADLAPYHGMQYYGGRHGVTERMCMARRLRFVRQVASAGRLLDFGCGDGGFLAAARAVGWGTTGVEMSPDDARAKGLDVVERVEDAAGPFDVITLWHSLEHVRSPRQCLESLVPLLAPGGHVLIAVPNRASWQAQLFGANWFHIDVPRHLSHFTPLAMTRLLAATGLEVARRWDLEAEIDLFGWTQSALNLVMPHPNVLFDTLTRRQRAHGTGEIVASVLVGAVATALSAPVVPLAAAAGRGGIMVFAARRHAA